MTYFERIGWSPVIGDPSFLGWVTVLTYIFTTYLSFRVATSSKEIFDFEKKKQQLLWLGITALFAFLSINKQLDLQTLFTRSFRYIAIEQGWYADRRLFQKAFILGVLLSTLVTVLFILKLYAANLKENLFAFLGISTLFCFILIRASSFHYVDIFLGIGFSNLGISNFILESIGIVLVAYNAQKLLSKKSAS